MNLDETVDDLLRKLKKIDEPEAKSISHSLETARTKYNWSPTSAKMNVVITEISRSREYLNRVSCRW